MDRRRFIAAGLAMTPLAAALSACGRSGAWPEGMVEIKWDRDTCARCTMAISDRRFAAEIRGGEKNIAFKFDDIGCATVWMRDKQKDYPWLGDAATRIWVADVGSTGEKWLEARQAHYAGGKMSPMGYNYGASPFAEAGALDFEEMRRQVLAKEK